MADLLFANNPAYAVDNIAFSAAIRSNNSGDVLIEAHKGLVGKAFKALDFQ